MVENLFFNTPARLKFLKRDATEKRHILQVVTRYAMAYPHIAFALRQDGREQFRSSGRGGLAAVAARVFGHEAFMRMLAVAGENSAYRGSTPIQVRGYASQPSLTRKDRSRINLFVNGRAIQDSSLSHAVAQAYDGMINAGAFPLAVILDHDAARSPWMSTCIRPKRKYDFATRTTYFPRFSARCARH